jgi:hypothetical protein
MGRGKEQPPEGSKRLRKTPPAQPDIKPRVELKDPADKPKLKLKVQ